MSKNASQTKNNCGWLPLTICCRSLVQELLLGYLDNIVVQNPKSANVQDLFQVSLSYPHNSVHLPLETGRWLDKHLRASVRERGCGIVKLHECMYLNVLILYYLFMYYDYVFIRQGHIFFQPRLDSAVVHYLRLREAQLHNSFSLDEILSFLHVFTGLKRLMGQLMTYSLKKHQLIWQCNATVI